MTDLFFAIIIYHYLELAEGIVRKRTSKLRFSFYDCKIFEWCVFVYKARTGLRSNHRELSNAHVYSRDYTKFGIKVLWSVQFLEYLRTLSLKFQKARTKIEVVLALPCWLLRYLNFYQKMFILLPNLLFYRYLRDQTECAPMIPENF